MAVKEPHDQAVQRINKNGKTVYEMQFDCLGGYLKNIEYVNEERNGVKSKEYRLHFLDDGKEYVLSVNWDTRNAQNIINSLANIKDFSKPITIRPYLLTSEKTGKPVAGCTVYAGLVVSKDKKIVGKYSREDMPALKQVEFKGEVQWDATDLAKFLLNVVNTEIIPALSNAQGAQMLDALDGISSLDVADDDGLPF